MLAWSVAAQKNMYPASVELNDGTSSVQVKLKSRKKYPYTC